FERARLAAALNPGLFAPLIEACRHMALLGRWDEAVRLREQVRVRTGSEHAAFLFSGLRMASWRNDFAEIRALREQAARADASSLSNEVVQMWAGMLLGE